jgi:diguanylate cyclase (GGDEF)-like protein
MAASDSNRDASASARGPHALLSARALEERLAQEISRAARHGTALACLLVVIENMEELAERYGGDLLEQAPLYLAAALEPGLRRFDSLGRPQLRELVLLLPGADGPRAEVVARRALERLRAIKVEAQGRRMALRIAVGLAEWQDGMSVQALLEGARVAARAGASERLDGEDAGPLD